MGVLDQANIIDDEVIGDLETTLDDVLTEKIPALMDAVKDAMPDSVDTMVDAAWSEATEGVEKVSNSGSATAVRSALEEQLASVEGVLDFDGLTDLITRQKDLGKASPPLPPNLPEQCADVTLPTP